jgi:hypothetical protein
MKLELANGVVLDTKQIESVVPTMTGSEDGILRPGCKVRYLDGRTVKVPGITASEVMRLVKENECS